VTALGELLELLDGAGRSFRTVRMATLHRTVTAGQLAALERHAAVLRARGEEREPWQLRWFREQPAATTEWRLRLRHEPPRRWRVERGDSVFVDDGAREWHYDPPGPASVLRSQSATRWGVEHLLEPTRLLPGIRLEPAGETTWIGRRVLRARAVSRKLDDAVLDEWLVPGADVHELLVDAERGTVLRLASLLDGTEIGVTAVEEIAFDEDPAGWFVFDPPPGVSVLDAEERLEPEEVSLAEAAARAPFVVLAPRRVPAGATVHVLYAADPERWGRPPAVGIRLELPGARSLSLSEGPEQGWGADEEEWEVHEREGRRILARDMMGQRQARTEHLGTRVSLVSDLPVETLVEIAASLEPVGGAA
jgi:hypothetical protein